jgi:hypothetical protein
MELELKKQIVEAAKGYAAENGLTQDAISEQSGVNIRYINAMFQDYIFLKSTSGKPVPIKDAYFKKLAKSIGYNIERVFWDLVETPQYVQIYTELLDARSSGRVKMLIGETGCGKTYTINRFIIENPVDSYRITVSSLHNLNNIINELCDLLNLSVTSSRVSNLKKIAHKFCNIRLDGGNPILILDEMENLRIPALKMLKALYDAIRDYCPIVLIGTSQLSNKLDFLSEKDVEGIPQFARRFKAGRRDILPINKRSFAPFLDKVSDDDLRVLIESLASNYGELNDFIEPALREAARNGEELTEESFRFQFGLIRKAI